MASGQRIAQIAAEIAEAPTAGAALRRLTELRRQLDVFERRQVQRALADGATFAAIARDLGLSRQAVHRRFRDLAGAEAPLMTAPDVRRVLQLAREEAQRLGVDELGGEHVVLAVLRAGALPAADVLRDAGATLERARTQLAGAMPSTTLFRRENGTGDVRVLLVRPAREARASGSRRIEVEHVLLAALGEPGGGAVRMLRALGVDVDALRSALGARLSRGGDPLELA